MPIQVNWDGIPDQQRPEWRELVRVLNDMESRDAEFKRALQLDGAVNPKKMANAAPPKRFLIN